MTSLRSYRSPLCARRHDRVAVVECVPEQHCGRRSQLRGLETSMRPGAASDVGGRVDAVTRRATPRLRPSLRHDVKPSDAGAGCGSRAPQRLSPHEDRSPTSPRATSPGWKPPLARPVSWHPAIQPPPHAEARGARRPAAPAPSRRVGSTTLRPCDRVEFCALECFTELVTISGSNAGVCEPSDRQDRPAPRRAPSDGMRRPGAQGLGRSTLPCARGNPHGPTSSSTRGQRARRRQRGGRHLVLLASVQFC